MPSWIRFSLIYYIVHGKGHPLRYRHTHTYPMGSIGKRKRNLIHVHYCHRLRTIFILKYFFSTLLPHLPSLTPLGFFLFIVLMFVRSNFHTFNEGWCHFYFFCWRTCGKRFHFVLSWLHAQVLYLAIEENRYVYLFLESYDYFCMLFFHSQLNPE